MRALFDLPAAYAPSDTDRAAPVPAVTAVLFDFSNTLFHMVAVEEWLHRVADDVGRALEQRTGARGLADVLRLVDP